MSSVTNVLDTVQAAAGSPLVSSLLVLSLSAILFSLFSLVASGLGYLVLLAWASYERSRVAGSSNKARTSSDKFERGYGFNERWLAMVLAIQLGALWSALAGFATIVVSGGRRVVEFVLGNLGVILGLLAIFPLVVAWDAYHEVLFQSIGEIYNCFVAPLVRPLFLPVVNLYSLFFGSVFPVSNATRQILNGVTTTTAARVLVCAGAATGALVQQLITVAIAFSGAVTVWLQQPNQNVFRIAPDFYETGVEAGIFVANLQVFADCACQPLSQIAVAPFFVPFESDDFAHALNNTLNVPVVAVSQGLAAPVFLTFQNIGATPGAPFGDVLSRPSFNSSFDVTTAAMLGIGNVMDRLTVSAYQVLVNTVTALVSPCPSFPGWSNTAPCRTGVVQGICSAALECNTATVIDTGCCRMAGGVCAPNVTASFCTDLSGEFRRAACAEFNPECFSGTRTGCCVRGASQFVRSTASWCGDNTADTECSAPGDLFLFGETCNEFLARNQLVSCPVRTPGLLVLPPEERACGACSGALGSVCQCTDCLCEYQNGALEATASCAAGTDQSTCTVEFNGLPEPLTPALFTGIAGAIDALIAQPARLLFHAAWNADIVFTTFDGFLYFDLQPAVTAGEQAVRNLTALNEWIALWVEDLGGLAAEIFEDAPSQSPVVNGAPGIGALGLKAKQIDETLGTVGDLLNGALRTIAKLLRVPRGLIIAVVDFLLEGIRLNVNLLVGTAWLTAETATNGAANPLAYVQRLWGDEIPAGVRYSCFARPQGGARFNMFGVTLRNESGTPCNAEAAALSYCRFVFQRALAQNVTTPSTELNALSNPPAFLRIDAPSFTLRSNVVNCVQTAARCRAAVEVTFSVGRVPRNEIKDSLLNFVAIASAFDPIFAVFCPDCVNLQNIFTKLAEPFVRLLTPGLDALIHIDKLLTTSYVKCLDLISAAEAVQDFVATFTDVYREIEFGISNSQCAAGSTARDARIFCVLAQGFDAIVELFAAAVSMLWNLALAIVGVIDGSISDLAVLTDLASITQLEAPILTLSFDLVSLLVQVIPSSLECAQPGCCAVSTNRLPNFSTDCVRNGFEKDCIGVFYEGRLCGEATLSGGRFNNASFSGSQLCELFNPTNRPPFDSTYDGDRETGCCQTLLAGRATNVARICVDDRLAGECVQPDDIFVREARCFTARPIRCPVSRTAKDVVADSLGILLSDVLLLLPRITVGAVRSLAKIITQFNATDPFTDLIEAVYQPFFVLIGNGFDQVARMLLCAGSRAASLALNQIGSAISDILAVGMRLLSSLVLLVFYVVMGLIEVILKGTTVVLKQAGQLLVDTIFFFAFAILGEKGICDVQDTACFLCNSDLIGACDVAIDFAVNQCRRFSCCTRTDIDKDGQLCADDPGSQDDGKVIPATCRCTDILNPVTTCSTTQCANNNRRRSAPLGANPFASIMTAELTQAKNGKRGVLLGGEDDDASPTAEFCGAYLATYGFDKARNERRSGSNSTAAQCVGVSSTSQRAVSVEAAVDRYVMTRLSEAVAALAQMRDDAQAHWQDMHREATEQAALRTKVARGDPAAIALYKEQTPYGVTALLARERNFQPRALHKRTDEEHVEYREHLSGLLRTHGADVSRNLVIHAMASYMHLNDHWDSPFSHFTDAITAASDKQRKRTIEDEPAVATDPVAALGARRMQLGLRLAMYHGGAYMQRVSAGLGRLAASLVERSQRAASTAPATTTLRHVEKPATLVFDNASLGLINLPPCNATEQGLCTGCLVLDDAIRVVQISGNGLADFYSDDETGYLSYVDRFVEGINNSLINPRGNDMFTTPNKRVPWIGERLATVRWFWQWNYTQLTTIVNSGNSSSNSIPSNQTENLQRARARAVGREDHDNFFFDQFGVIVRPLVRIVDSFVDVSGGVSDGSNDVLSDLFITYLQCDYQGALQCNSPNLGVGLFDGIANTLLIYIIIGTVLVSINVMFGFSLFVLLVPFSYPIAMWIAYGASPLCTGPSLILGIPGIPTCLPADIYTLIAETLQQCPVVPISLIKPTELAAAGRFLCTTCGAVPSLVNCAEFGFLNGLDVFFYSAPSIFGDAFNARAASALAGVAPDIATVATLYTAEYIAGLGEAGLVCNRVMLPTLLTASGIVAARLALVGSLLFSIALLSAAAFWLIWTILLWINEVIRQVDEGFVQQTRVEKLKFKQN